MREIIDIKFSNTLHATCVFSDNTSKQINLTEIAKSPVFQFLNNETHIHYLVNQKYYIEWPMFEVDLSADTLWHIAS